MEVYVNAQLQSIDPSAGVQPGRPPAAIGLHRNGSDHRLCENRRSSPRAPRLRESRGLDHAALDGRASGADTREVSGPTAEQMTSLVFVMTGDIFSFRAALSHNSLARPCFRKLRPGVEFLVGL
jgi:hypothetical protein